MRSPIQDVLDYAEDKLSREMYRVFLANDPVHHAPMWHELGVVGHMAAVVAAAEHLLRETGQDIVQLAVYHDIGKIRSFPDAIALYVAKKDPALAYHGHESWSAKIARGIKPMHYWDSETIRFHHLAYSGAKTETVLKHFEHHPDRIRRWMLLSAADAVGKGWTPAQRKQRPMVAQNFLDIAVAAGLSSEDRVVSVCSTAVLSWDLPETNGIVAPAVRVA